MQLNLQLTAPETTPVANGFSVGAADGRVSYFSNLMPFKSHDADDRQARALALAELRVECDLPAGKIVRATGVSRSSLMQYCRIYREHGVGGFFRPRKAKVSTAIDARTKREAEDLLAQGFSAYRVAKRCGIAVSTLTCHIRKGKILVKGAKPGAVATVRAEGGCQACAATHRTQRDERDCGAPMGRAASDAARNWSMSPSSTASGLLLSIPVRRSFTMR